MDVIKRTLRSLEWDRLKHYLAEQTNSAVSRQLALDLEPSVQPYEIRTWLDQSRESLFLLDSKGIDFGQPGLPDLREALARLSAGAVLNGGELLAVARTMKLSRQAKTSLSPLDEDDFPRLRSFLTRLSVTDELVGHIERVIDEEGHVRDDASSTLRNLRRETQRLTSTIKEELTKIINSSSLSKCLQELLYTQRNGRYVLPVNASMRGQISGIVHDSSASGLTVFVEPMSVVELTNRIRLAEVEIEREIEKLLADLSALARKSFEPVTVSYDSLVELDFIAARGRLARKYSGHDVRLTDEAVIKLKQARHPLLILGGTVKSVVGNDIDLDQTTRTLVITGPNTGGKTVYLKTAGIIALMVRAGLLPPVDPGGSIGILSQVFADIGDEQSLEQNLSTFSSHMRTIVEIVNKAAPGTLVLLDEIGAGTDPREGAVLARVILRHLAQLGVLTITSTHFGDLKALAHGEEGFANAGMQFDEASLVPTYKLIPGQAGSSRAFVIASRLGMDQALVDECLQILESQRPEVELRIEEMEKRLVKLTEREADVFHRELELADRELKIKDMNQQSQDRLAKLKQSSKDEFEDEWRQARKMISELTSSLQKNPSLPRLQEAQKKLVQIKEDLGWKDEVKEKGGPAYTVGQTVKLVSLNQIGTIESIADESCQVRIGSMKVKANLADLEPAQGKSTRAQHRQNRANTKAVWASTEPNTTFVRTESNTIDLRGKRVDEAMSEVERFLDEACLSQVSPIMIIHGHGTGAVKAAVRDYLATAGYDAKYRPGENHEGGDGVTVVLFS